MRFLRYKALKSVMGPGRAGSGREYSDFSLKFERTRSARCARSLVTKDPRSFLGVTLQIYTCPAPAWFLACWATPNMLLAMPSEPFRVVSFVSTCMTTCVAPHLPIICPRSCATFSAVAPDIEWNVVPGLLQLACRRRTFESPMTMRDWLWFSTMKKEDFFFKIFKILKIWDSSFIALLILRHFI